MRRTLSIILLALLAVAAWAQDTRVQNRPYTDLRPFHFGVMVGTHWEDLEFENLGPQTVQGIEGTKTVTVDQDRWDMGFTVGVLGEARLGTHFAFRLAPAMYFGTRHLTFMNLTDTDGNGEPVKQGQDLKSVYISAAMDLIFSAPRFNNHRPYLMVGFNPMINLAGGDSDYIKLKKYDAFVEFGLGCDFYLPFFKLRPELKFCYSLANSLDKSHKNRFLPNAPESYMYANAAKEARSKIIALTFYFE